MITFACLFMLSGVGALAWLACCEDIWDDSREVFHPPGEEE